MKRLVIGLGAGGHARVLIEILQYDESCTIVGLLDPGQELHGLDVIGVPVLGGDELLLELARGEVDHFFIGLGGVGNNQPRQRLFELALQHDLKPITAIHPKANISPSAEIGAGAAIMAGAVVNACAQLGQNVIVNTNAVVEHDCKIGDHVHIATGALLAGAVHVGRGAHIGVGAVVKQGVDVGEASIVGAGAVVVKNVPAFQTVIGIPASPIPQS